ncbi:MAG: P22 coat protein - protein 5 domain protein [Actinobacteria bacterium]|nr:P22 coat protein - protein 5 domain protein [Actinomycetota bacterium]
MALDNFIPEVWHNSVLTNLKNDLVYAGSGLVNSDYSADLVHGGDTVHINSIGAVTVGTYSKNQGTSITPQILSDSQMTFVIDQSDYFAFEIDDIDAAQQNPKVMANAMREAAFALGNVVDTFVRDLLNNGTPAANTLSAVTANGSTTWGAMYEAFVDLSVKLDENNCPREGRWAVVSPAQYGVLLKDARFVSFGTDANRSTIADRAVGNIAGLNIYVSNKAPTSSSNPVILAGHNWATTFANNIEKVEAYRPQGRFSDAVKGLHVYGGKVIRPELLAKVAVDVTP